MLQWRRSFLAIGAALSISVTLSAGAARAADASCDAAAARARLAALKAALQRPDSSAAIDAAKQDFADDQKFDNEHNAKYLAAAAVYIKLEDQLDAGSVGDACRFLGQADALINEIIAGK
jgi:hypothetical protein